MSYCRWSCNDYQCDLYCYETQGGYQTHVAKLKRVLTEPLPPVVPFTPENTKVWFDRYNAVGAIIDAAPLVPIGLPSDGEDYLDETLEEFLATLLRLKEEGYRFPSYVIDDVRHEIAIQKVPLPTDDDYDPGYYDDEDEDDDDEDFDMDDEEEEEA